MDYLIPGLLGFLSGAILFGLTYQSVYPAISKIANLGNVTLPEALHVNPWLVIIFFAEISLLLFYWLARKGDPRKDVIQES